MECPHDHAKTLPQVIFLRSPFLLPAETACAGSSLKGNTARDGGVFRRHAARAFLLCRRNIFLFGNAERHTAPYLPAWKICRTCRGGSVDSLHKGWGGMPALTGRPQSVPRASPLPCRPLNRTRLHLTPPSLPGTTPRHEVFHLPLPIPSLRPCVFCCRLFRQREVSP